MKKSSMGAKTVPTMKEARPSTNVGLTKTMKSYGRNVARAMYQKSAGRGR